jgi:hypothetical protein
MLPNSIGVCGRPASFWGKKTPWLLIRNHGPGVDDDPVSTDSGRGGRQTLAS